MCFSQPWHGLEGNDSRGKSLIVHKLLLFCSQMF